MSGRPVWRRMEPEVLRWARRRAGLAPEALAAGIGVRPDRVGDWERSGRITMAQADRLARRTHTPLGFLYLREPPEDSLPIPDFRAPAGSSRRPSPELLDTVHHMIRRQAWMREELLEDGMDPLPIVGCCGSGSMSARCARAMRRHLELEPGWAATQPSWTHTLRFLRRRAESAGILIVINGVVGNNTHRRLDPDEFRGFSLTDDYAPLVFVNGADFRTAQMFTLAHELAHIAEGSAGVSGAAFTESHAHDIERFCDGAAAEFLVPADELVACWKRVGTIDDSLQAVARRFRVSVLVAAWRTVHLDLIGWGEFRRFYEAYRLEARSRRLATGGNFWNNQDIRIGRRFGSAVRRAVLEGRLSYREAYSLTGLRGKSFDTFIGSIERTS